MANTLSPVTVLVGISGAVLIYGAVTNRNPIDVVKLTLQGRPLSEARTISTPSTGYGPGTIPGNELPGTPQADGDARTDPPGFDPNNSGVNPNPYHDPSPGGGARPV